MTDNAKITATLKGGKDFDAPWIVVHADTAAQARDILGEIEASGLLVDVGRVGAGLQAQTRLGSTLGARPIDAPQAAPQQSWSEQGTAAAQQPAYAPQQPPQQGGWNNAPQQQQGGWQQQQPQANPNDAKHCVHGPMTFRPAGVSKRTGNAYAAFWACGSNVKGCKAIN